MDRKTVSTLLTAFGTSLLLGFASMSSAEAVTPPAQLTEASGVIKGDPDYQSGHPSKASETVRIKRVNYTFRQGRGFTFKVKLADVRKFDRFRQITTVHFVGNTPSPDTGLWSVFVQTSNGGLRSAWGAPGDVDRCDAGSSKFKPKADLVVLRGPKRCFIPDDVRPSVVDVQAVSNLKRKQNGRYVGYGDSSRFETIRIR